jgi:hypothetical protein
MTNATKLETETCGRCGGTGKHSYNQMHGDVCYGCAGSGTAYTKRGKAAAAFLDELRKVPASTIKVGDTIRVNAMTFSYFAKVTAVGTDSGSRYMKDGAWVPYYSIDTEHPKFGASGQSFCSPTDLVRKGFSAEEKVEQLKKALEFQATLTKLGKPRK